MIDLRLGDCLELMPTIPDHSIDLILCDLPYGTTQCKWDTVIPLDRLWTEYKRLIKLKGAIILTASQPFTSALVMSNPKWFKWDIVWCKVRVTGHLDAKRKPLRKHESVLVFCEKMPIYHPQMVQGENHVRGPWGKHNSGHSDVYNDYLDNSSRQNTSDLYYPTSIIEFRSELKPVHPTQKPVALMEYLIRTYTDENAMVLDNCMGSGTTGVACVNTNRSFVGYEKEERYFAIAQARIQRALDGES